MSFVSLLLTFASFVSLSAVGGCSNGGDPISSPADTIPPPADTIPLDGRGGGILAYTYQPGSTNDHHQVFVMNADGSGGRPLITAPIGINHHDWSPDGQQLAAVGYYGDTWSIHPFNADGSGLRRLTSTLGVWDNEPTWSPDGTEIALTRTYPTAGYRSEIRLMNADGTNQRAIGVEGFIARWSPDGDRLIYQSTM